MAGKEEKVVIVPKTPAEIQRIKLQKLMSKPDKPVVIPDGPREKAPRAPPEFVRNVWGSSAGAGSGEFHVYRGIRRREYARQKFNTEKSERDQLDDEYVQKVEQNKKAAEGRTAKKRAKRQKKKQKMKAKKPKTTKNDEGQENDEESEEEEEEEEDSELNIIPGGGNNTNVETHLNNEEADVPNIKTEVQDEQKGSNEKLHVTGVVKKELVIKNEEKELVLKNEEND